MIHIYIYMHIYDNVSYIYIYIYIYNVPVADPCGGDRDLVLQLFRNIRNDFSSDHLSSTTRGHGGHEGPRRGHGRSSRATRGHVEPGVVIFMAFTQFSYQPAIVTRDFVQLPYQPLVITEDFAHFPNQPAVITKEFATFPYQPALKPHKKLQKFQQGGRMVQKRPRSMNHCKTTVKVQIARTLCKSVQARNIFLKRSWRKRL